METSNKTFRIEASTNGYIASRDITFNGKTKVTLLGGLFYEQAREKLTEFAISDYDSMNVIERVENEEEFLKFYFQGLTSEMAHEVRVSDEVYFETHKKMLNCLYSKNKNKLEKFTGAGLYGMGQMPASAILEDTDNGYEFDSRYYKIVEETEEEA